MPNKILLIENDRAFADSLSGSLEAAGFEVSVTDDGKDGLELARDLAPDAIVLCVELPSLSGYLVCQKLKKDESLRAIPLVLTSAEATEETFEKHKTLKARADEYLLKPYEPDTLIDKLNALVGIPEGADDLGEEEEEELVSLEEEMGLEAAAGAGDDEAPGLTLESLPDEPVAEVPGPGAEEELKLLEDAFDGLSEPRGSEEPGGTLDDLGAEKPIAGDEVDAAAASLPDEDEATGREQLSALDQDAEGALDGLDETLSPMLEVDEQPAPARPVRGASADLLRAAGIKLLDEQPARNTAIAPPLPEPPRARQPDPDDADLDTGAHRDDEALERAREDLAERDAELRDLRRKLEVLSRRAKDAESELSEVKARAEALQDRARKAEADAKMGRDEARRAAEQARSAEAELDELRREASDAQRRAADAEKRAVAAEQEARRKANEAAEAIGRADALEHDADELRTELLVARGEADGARGEIERRAAELKKRIAELEASNGKNEERVVKAYQKIKADEKVRDKVRKALAIASQLLDEGAAGDAPADERRAASAGRE